MFDKQAIWTVRVKPKGGSVAPVVNAPARPLGCQHAMIFVHGYNTNEERATDAYAAMIQSLRDVLSSECAGAPPGDIGIAKFFWPGDIDLGRFSGISYPMEIDTAEKSARRLGDFLSGPSGLDEVSIIGHSLGCRLVLELLHLVRKPTWARFPRVRWALLAAGAVPMEALVPDARLRDTAPVERDRVRVRFSPDDGVLKWLFPIGQLLAGEPSSEALGLYGCPRSWSGTAARLHGAGHGDYWGHADVASDMLRALEIALAHRTPDHSTPTYRPAGS